VDSPRSRWAITSWHDAELASINGIPRVITATFSSRDSNPADLTPLYQFENGGFQQKFPPMPYRLARLASV
jgi:hypothetical protein